MNRRGHHFDHWLVLSRTSRVCWEKECGFLERKSVDFLYAENLPFLGPCHRLTCSRCVSITKGMTQCLLKGAMALYTGSKEYVLQARGSVQSAWVRVIAIAAYMWISSCESKTCNPIAWKKRRPIEVLMDGQSHLWSFIMCQDKAASLALWHSLVEDGDSDFWKGHYCPIMEWRLSEWTQGTLKVDRLKNFWNQFWRAPKSKKTALPFLPCPGINEKQKTDLSFKDHWVLEKFILGLVVFLFSFPVLFRRNEIPNGNWKEN